VRFWPAGSRSLPSHRRPTLIPRGAVVDLCGTVSVKTLAPAQDLGGGQCATSLWTFKEGSNSGGPPDLRGRSRRKNKNLKGKVNSLPNPQIQKKNPPS